MVATKNIKFNVVNVLGKKVSNIELSKDAFGIKPHNQAMFDLVLSERASLRSGNHSTKTRSEVSGGGRKPWKQKGTGRARQGSIRSPQWRGGGIVFGPTPLKNYTLKINKKIRKLAMQSGLSYLAQNDRFIIVDNIEFKNPSTKDFEKMLKNFESDTKKVLLILNLNDQSYKTYLSARNLPNVLVVDQSTLFLDDLLNSNKIVMTEEVAKIIDGRFQ